MRVKLMVEFEMEVDNPDLKVLIADLERVVGFESVNGEIGSYYPIHQLHVRMVEEIMTGNTPGVRSTYGLSALTHQIKENYEQRPSTHRTPNAAEEAQLAAWQHEQDLKQGWVNCQSCGTNCSPNCRMRCCQ